jgi:hypothetical protein
MHIKLPNCCFRVAILTCVAAGIVCFDFSVGFAEPRAAKQAVPPRNNNQSVVATSKVPVVWGGPALRRIEDEWAKITGPSDMLPGSVELFRLRRLIRIFV